MFYLAGASLANLVSAGSRQGFGNPLQETTLLSHAVFERFRLIVRHGILQHNSPFVTYNLAQYNFPLLPYRVPAGPMRNKHKCEF